MMHLNSRNGFSLLEMIVAATIGAGVLLGVFKLLQLSSRHTSATQSTTAARDMADEILATTQTNFRRRFVSATSAIPSGVEMFSLTSPLAFKPNTGGAGRFRCPDGTFPSCQNLRMLQIASTTPTDTFRTVELKTTCSDPTATRPFPSDFDLSTYASDGSSCLGPPQVTRTTADFPSGTVTENRGFSRDEVIGSALCVRACKRGSTLFDYTLELSILHRLGAEWKVHKTRAVLSTSDIGSGVTILPR